MSTAEFPNDENGNILRKMVARGDDLLKPRIVDFSFIFPERKQALAFAEILDDKDLEICISYFDAKDMWQAIVKRRMTPTHGEISSIEAELTLRAESVGGEADGWGCFIMESTIANAIMDIGRFG